MVSPPPLEQWLPHLLTVWRGGKGLQDGLTASEADRVAAGVRELSRGLTGDRTLAGAEYLARNDLLGAYLLYYWPVSFAQTLFALRQGGIPSGDRALDLGSGPAPGGFALLEAGWRRVTAADRSPEALGLAKKLAVQGGKSLETVVWEAEGPFPVGGPWELIVVGHFLNELGSGAADRLERRVAFLNKLKGVLAPGGRILLLEPASHGPNTDALAVRDAVAAAGWTIAGPCFFQGACPARAAGAACHDVLKWKVPHLVAQTARRAGIDKRELPFTWLVLRPDGPVPSADPSLVRVVSEPLMNKAGRRRVVVCGLTGRFSLSAPGAYRSPLWLQVGRGQALRVTDPEVRGAGWGLLPSTQLSIAPPSAPGSSPPEARR
jgi:SAM-dependent methyltransferase